MQNLAVWFNAENILKVKKFTEKILRFVPNIASIDNFEKEAIDIIVKTLTKKIAVLQAEQNQFQTILDKIEEEILTDTNTYIFTDDEIDRVCKQYDNKRRIEHCMHEIAKDLNMLTNPNNFL